MEKFSLVTISFLALLFSCDAEKSSGPFDDKQFETKPESSALDTSEDNLMSEEESQKPAINLKWQVRVSFNSGVELCRGSVEGHVFSNYRLVIKDGQKKLKCSELTLSFDEILKGLSIDISTIMEKMSTTESRKFLEIDDLMGVHFNPARPFILNPIITNPQKYQGFKSTIKTIATGRNLQGKTVSTPGNMTIEVHETGIPFTSSANQQKFDNVIHWSITNEGFKGLPQLVGMLYSRMDYWWAIPFNIPRIRVVTDDSDLVNQAFSGSETAGTKGPTIDIGSVLGPLIIDLEVEDPI